MNPKTNLIDIEQKRVGVWQLIAAWMIKLSPSRVLGHLIIVS